MTSHDECTKECAKTATPKSGWFEHKSLMLVTPDPFPSPAHIKKKVKGLARQTTI